MVEANNKQKLFEKPLLFLYILFNYWKEKPE